MAIIAARARWPGQRPLATNMIVNGSIFLMVALLGCRSDETVRTPCRPSADILLRHLAFTHERSGDLSGAASLYRQAADRGDPGALHALARLSAQAGDSDAAVRLGCAAASSDYATQQTADAILSPLRTSTCRRYWKRHRQRVAPAAADRPRADPVRGQDRVRSVRSAGHGGG
ncbi:hypothetical protein Are01nite_61850 [Actinoplanes regularis]|nr:hypothetical protein Are01nite_61850 [Actinoplanes regularis]